jgi:hypothetical protein
MEEITEGVNAIKKNRIQVSNTKKPLLFYVNLAKVLSLAKYMYLLRSGLLNLHNLVLFNFFKGLLGMFFIFCLLYSINDGFMQISS